MCDWIYCQPASHEKNIMWLIPYHFSEVTVTYLLEEHVPLDNWMTILAPEPFFLTCIKFNISMDK